MAGETECTKPCCVGHVGEKQVLRVEVTRPHRRMGRKDEAGMGSLERQLPSGGQVRL